MLDAACGTGHNAAALARRGYRVRATDGSDAMVAMAAARFRREHLDIPLERCLWADLPAVIGERFDVVLCIGNSLVHTGSRDAMVEALTGLRQMARPGGYVVVDSRNWEKIHAERRTVRVADRVRTRERPPVRQPVRLGDTGPVRPGDVAHIVFLFEDGDRIEPQEYRIDFRPFTPAELRERLAEAGLRVVGTDFDDARDQYAVVASRPDGRRAAKKRLAGCNSPAGTTRLQGEPEVVSCSWTTC